MERSELEDESAMTAQGQMARDVKMIAWTALAGALLLLAAWGAIRSYRIAEANKIQVSELQAAENSNKIKECMSSRERCTGGYLKPARKGAEWQLIVSYNDENADSKIAWYKIREMSKRQNFEREVQAIVLPREKEVWQKAHREFLRSHKVRRDPHL